MKPRKAAREPAAPEKVAERLLDKPRQPFTVAEGGSVRTERLEVISNDLVENRVARRPRFVKSGGHAGIGAAGMPVVATREMGEISAGPD
jgi:hypothetical protein